MDMVLADGDTELDMGTVTVHLTSELLLQVVHQVRLLQVVHQAVLLQVQVEEVVEEAGLLSSQQNLRLQQYLGQLLLQLQRVVHQAHLQVLHQVLHQAPVVEETQIQHIRQGPMRQRLKLQLVGRALFHFQIFQVILWNNIS